MTSDKTSSSQEGHYPTDSDYSPVRRETKPRSPTFKNPFRPFAIQSFSCHSGQEFGLEVELKVNKEQLGVFALAVPGEVERSGDGVLCWSVSSVRTLKSKVGGHNVTSDMCLQTLDSSWWLRPLNWNIINTSG